MDKPDNQVLYNGRWIPKAHFRAFVYSKDERRLAKSYEEYSNMISSGTWFAEPMGHTNKNEENVVSMKDAKRGNKCRNQAKT